MNSVLINQTRLNLCLNFGLIIGFSLLAGCSSFNGISTATSEGPTETAILSTAELPATFVPSPTPVPLPTAAPSAPENIVKFQPFEVASDVSAATKPVGALAICSDSTIQLLRFTPEVKTETIPGIADEIFCLATSPDGQWIAYEQDFGQSPTGAGNWLVVQSTDGQQQKKVPRDPVWLNFGDYVWLNNQHLIFNNFRNPPDIQRFQKHPAYPMVVVNPFTGANLEIPSDYPELTLSDGPIGALSFNYSDVVYDTSLELVIFPTKSGEHNYLVLWDRLSKVVLAKVEDQSGGFGSYPLWSPNATQFAVAVINAIKNGQAIEEWYRISREGKVEQLTHFGDYFSSSEIGSAANWSPDSQKLAFWIDLTPSPCPGLRLAILDTTTKHVTNSCLSGASSYAPPPIWSLDSRYLIIRDDSNPPIKTVLVDVENGQAFDITSLIGDLRPIGWMASP